MGAREAPINGSEVRGFSFPSAWAALRAQVLRLASLPQAAGAVKEVATQQEDAKAAAEERRPVT